MSKLVDMRHVRFLLYEVNNIEEVTKFPRHEDHSRETFDMALDTANQLAENVFWPAYQQCDREGAVFDGKDVTVPKGVHEIWRHCKEGGWFAPSELYDFGGQQFPLSIFALTSYLFAAGNVAAAMYVSSTWGAGHLIENFGSDDLKQKYMMKLFSGEWAGTMALTEPQAGTSIGDIVTTAEKAPDGDHYYIKGVKRFISSGDHDLAPNIVHPVLARIKGAPAGIKGISLFVVPKYRLDADGNPAEFNDVITAGIEHKLGLKAQATATLDFGDNDNCHGWLIGEPNSGLQCMFQLMNRARVYTGIQAVAGASVAYHSAVQYANERVQGRSIEDMKDPMAPQVPIIAHTDVRQMLLKQKAFIEGCLGLILYCAKKADIMENTENAEERDEVNLLLEVLTPCCKAHGSYGAFEAITLALQVFGGAGYCEEFPVAQLLRDNKVFSIYEGANGIQALDLLGRKVAMKAGAAVRALMGEIGKTLEEAAAFSGLGDIAEKVQRVRDEVIATTMHLGMLGMSGQVYLYVANASAYLDMFSRMALAWQLLRQAIAAQRALNDGATEADFYQACIETARFYVNTEVPHALATAEVIKSNEHTALDFKPEWF
jgi:alkylation response protein AidB-like acyl-CoA dehydrogenase